MKKNAFDLFGYCTMATLINLEMIVFWVCGAVPSIRAIPYYSNTNKKKGTIFDVGRRDRRYRRASEWCS